MFCSQLLLYPIDRICFHNVFYIPGMKPQDRLDAREGFENDKYNILVSTSVLEEGIDIQACNIVVRYMYIKDMIAKIQSKGMCMLNIIIIIMHMLNTPPWHFTTRAAKMIIGVVFYTSL